MGAGRRRANKAFMSGSLDYDASDIDVDIECKFNNFGRMRAYHTQKYRIYHMSKAFVSTILITGILSYICIAYIIS